EITQTHLQADPVPLSETLAPDQDVTDDDEWMRVTAEGRYDTAHQVTVRYKTRDGQPGVHVVTPLITESGDAILIDRGWMQTNNRGEKPDRVPAPPTGTVTVTGWLRPDSQADDQAVTPHGGQVRAIASGGITSHVPYDLYHGYISLRDSNPKPHPSLVAESKPIWGRVRICFTPFNGGFSRHWPFSGSVTSHTLKLAIGKHPRLRPSPLARRNLLSIDLRHRRVIGRHDRGLAPRRPRDRG